jgi:phosphoribosylformimino-5-aminoimidazole carboxamide ribotide isomerase
MILYPAIDLKDGQCVRLLRGAMDQATVFSDDPAAQARAFAEAGAEWLHLVDLNGAFAGRPVNAARSRRSFRRQACPASSAAASATWPRSRCGCPRALRASSSAPSPSKTPTSFAAARAFPGQVAVGIDARAGPRRHPRLGRPDRGQATDLARRFEDAGVAAIIYTDIDRDGAMQGPNVEATEPLARAVAIPVIASGGVSRWRT